MRQAVLSQLYSDLLQLLLGVFVVNVMTADMNAGTAKFAHYTTHAFLDLGN